MSRTCAREVALEVAERFFAPREASALTWVPPHQAQHRFWEYWTFKESYIKARGMGLSVPLDKFAFHFQDARAVEITIDRELADDPARWQFWQFRPSLEYLVALCAERTTGRPARVTARRVVPLRGERPLALECLRLSEAPADRT